MRPVELPFSDLISLRDFASAIAESLLPIKADAINGIECIFGITRTVEFRGWGQQPQLFEPPTSPSPFVALKDGDPMPLHFAFSARDPYRLASERKILEDLLPQLPPLKYPMSDELVAAFMEAFNALEDKPDWAPRFLRRSDLELRVSEHHLMINDVLEDLVLSARDGHIMILDFQERYVSIQAIGNDFENLFVRRDGAFSYLHSLQLPVVVTDNQGEVAGIFLKSGKPLVRNGKKEWTDEERDALGEFLETIDPKTGEAYTQALACRLLDLTPGAISSQYKKYEERRAKNEAQKHDISLAGLVANLQS